MSKRTHIRLFTCAADASVALATWQCIDKIGLDVEWNSRHPTRPAAILQLSTGPETIVIQLSSTNCEPLPDSLVSILQNPSIAKFGVGIRQDIDRLEIQYTNLTISGAQDITQLANIHSYKARGLATLCDEVLQVALPKPKHIILSDWEADILDESQIMYAAADAFFSIELAHHLYKSEGHPPILYTSCSRNIKTVASSSAVLGNNSNANYCRTRPLFENIALEAPDGKLLAYINKSKLKWYLKNGLGNEMDDCNGNKTFRLNFEPSKRLEDSKIEKIENQCCVCGSSDKGLVKHSIIPNLFKKCLPIEAKCFVQSDLVSLCPKCNYRCQKMDDKYKSKLLNEIGVDVKKELDLKEAHLKIGKAYKCAQSLTIHGSKMSRKQFEFLWSEIKSIYMDVFQRIAPSDLTVILAECSKFPPQYIIQRDIIKQFATQIVQHYSNKGELGEFVVGWRKHFLNSMHPKHMPGRWKVACLELRKTL